MIRSALAAGIAAILVGGCMPGTSPTGAPDPTSTPPAASQTAEQSASTAASASPEASASAAELLPIAGVWRVRKVLAPGDQSGLVDDPAFDEETYAVTPGCPTEPCDTIEVTTTPLGLTGPATVIALERDDATYASTAQPTDVSSCVNTVGDRVDGGASATSTLRLWTATDRPAGSSVASTLIRGSVDLDIMPTPIGESAGCEPVSATFDLTGRREEVAVRDPDGSPDGPDVKPPAGAALVRLPSLSAKVSGATADYFGIAGDTSQELVRSILRAGGKACGVVEYEWFRGDARPSACTVTRLTDIREAIRTSANASGSCRITDADIQASYTIHLPRWTEPAQVPKRLLEWWRKVVDFIADHEVGHVRIGRDHIDRLNARLVGKACEDVDSIIRAWVKEHAAAQEAYDRGEYSRPWPAPPAGY